MKAVWYTEQGPAAAVLQYGTLPDPQPAAGEVRVRLTVSGVNPGDTKKRVGWLGSSMPFPLVIPHSDGAGVIDAVGDGVDPARVGMRVWVFGAQSYRASGTAAQYTCVPSWMAHDLPDDVPDEVGACLGVPGITAHRAVFGDGPVTGQTILVHGVAGAVPSLAAQLARLDGARVIGTVRRPEQVASLDPRVADHVIVNDAAASGAIRELSPGGVDRVVDVDLASNIARDAEVLRIGGTIAAFGSHQDPVQMPFWPMLFDNITIRLLGSDDFPVEAKQQAAADLTRQAARMHIAVAQIFPLSQAAQAHETVDNSPGGRILLTIPD